MSNKVLLSVNSGVADIIVLDSSASGHYLKHQGYFTTFLPINSLVYGANGSAIPILGIGSAIVNASTGPIVISKAFYVPDLSNSLIPQSFYIRQGYTISPICKGFGFQCHQPGHNLCFGSTWEDVLLIDLNSHQTLATTAKSPLALKLHQAHNILSYPQTLEAIHTFCQK
jgi:hypothetical protein